MAECFGARLRQQRERQQIALASIAEQTKISLSLLEGLERDDLLRWPTGIFRRAFVRAYAQAIGLDADSVVREFLEVHPDPVEVAGTAAAAPSPASDEPVSPGPSTRLRRLIDRAIGSLPPRRLQLGFTNDESPPDSATTTATVRDPAKGTSLLDPDLAVAVPLSTLTAIERAAAVTRDAAKAASRPRADVLAAAHLSTGTTGRAPDATRDAVKAGSSPRAGVTAAAHLSTGTATERPTGVARDAMKAGSPPRADVLAAAHLSTGTTGRAPDATRDSVQPTPPPRADHLPARPSTETAFENAIPTVVESAKATSSREPDLAAAAYLCTELGRVVETRDVPPLLEGAAKILNAIGLIVWVWDPQGTALRPALAHGYSDDVLAQLPGVRPDADNATATAFRSEETRIVSGSDLASGAVVVPLMTPAGCGGVLAVELRHGREHNEAVRALAMIFAAQLATLIGFVPLPEAVNA
jgi:cytoskeletal protein RodZ